MTRCRSQNHSHTSALRGYKASRRVANINSGKGKEAYQYGARKRRSQKAPVAGGGRGETISLNTEKHKLSPHPRHGGEEAFGGRKNTITGSLLNSTPSEGSGGGVYSFASCHSHLTIDHTSLSRRRRGGGLISCTAVVV